MIKQIIRITYRPIQSIFYGIRQKQNRRKMMAYVLKINPKNNHCALIKG